MRRIATTIGAAALTAGSLMSGCAQPSHTGHMVRTTIPDTTTPPAVQPLACVSYYYDGCMPRHWRRPGPRGWACYPC